MKLNGIVLIFATCFAAGVGAQNGPPQPGEGGQGGGGQGGPHRHGPPPEAFAACQGKVSGAVCSFTGRQNEKLTGTCFAPPAPPESAKPAATSSQSALACRPERDNMRRPD